MMRTALVFGLALVGCTEEGEDGESRPNPTGDTGTEQPDEACDNSLDESVPADGATDVYYRSSVRITLDDDDTSAVITLADADGADVPGTSVVEDDVVTFTPDAPLLREASYVATLGYECDEDETVSFTTSTTGNPTDGDVVGRVYNLDLREGTFTRPAGVGAIIGGLIPPEVALYLMADEIVSNGTETINFIGAPIANGQQDPCGEPFFVNGATWEDPHFSGQIDSLPVNISVAEISIVNLNISGDFSVDRSQIEIELFSGEIDGRELAGIEGSPLGPDPCLTLAGLGAECGPCSFEPTSETCVVLQVENLVLPYAPDADALVAEPDDCPL